MTIVLPKGYHATSALKKRRIQCISEQQALKQDIRALRIGIMNIMPQAEDYEYSLLFPLGRPLIQIEPVWLRLKTHRYNSTSKSHLDQFYVTFDEAIREQRLDGLIITGAPVEEMPFEKIYYWDEVQEILEYARKNVASTLGICWGGLALARFLGMEKEKYDRKKFGVYEVKNIDPSHRVTGELDDVFYCPVSSHSGIPDAVLEKEQKKGNVNLLAHSNQAGYLIFESSDQKFLMHLGHPEYANDRLIIEYRRDRKKNRDDVAPPENIDLKNPVNRWRGHCLEFFSQWIKYVYETTPY